MYEGLRCDCANTHSVAIFSVLLCGRRWRGGRVGRGGGGGLVFLGVKHSVMDDLCLSWIN